MPDIFYIAIVLFAIYGVALLIAAARSQNMALVIGGLFNLASAAMAYAILSWWPLLLAVAMGVLYWTLKRKRSK